jgi:flagellar biosynthesis/type III secretory pathway protein FliH
LENEKSTLEIQVSALQANISSLQTEIVSLESDVAENFNLGYAEGVSDGHDEGYAKDVEDLTQSGWYFMDPTYDEAIAFIDSDETDKNEYTEDYVCYDFTAEFNSNAFEVGYRCGFVYIEFD